MEIQGYCDPQLESVRQTFAELWDDIEVGASMTVYCDGQPVINLWGGHADSGESKPWQQDTLVNVYSTTKGIMALAIAMLVNEGRLVYEAPVSQYWPEFGAEEKFDVTVEQLLSHQAGLPGFDPPITVEELYNWQQMVFNLASQQPKWPPGTAFGYHAITWGFLAGEVIRRVTDLTPGEYVKKNITVPFEADVHIGLLAEHHQRCADLVGPNRARKTLPERHFPDGQKFSTGDPVITPYGHACSSIFRSAEIPASNGHATAMGLARCYNAALHNLLFTEETLLSATTEVTQGETDLVQAQPLRRSRGGFLLNSPDCFMGPSKQAFGHSGTGGSTAFADPENNIAFAYVMNQLHTNGPLRSRKIIDSLYSEVT